MSYEGTHVRNSRHGAPCAGCRMTTHRRREALGGVWLAICLDCDERAGQRHIEITAAIEGALRR